MSLIVNGTTIPTNGDFMRYNNTNLTKVVCNGKTVWEKQQNVILYDTRLLYGDPASGTPSVSNNYVVAPNYPIGNAKSTECVFYGGMDSSSQFEGPWTQAYGSFWAEDNRAAPFMVPTALLRSIRVIDVTNFKKVVLVYCGGIEEKPTGQMGQTVYMYLELVNHALMERIRGTDNKDYGNEIQKAPYGYCVGYRHYRTPSNPSGGTDIRAGSLWDGENGNPIWNSCAIDVSGLTGEYELHGTMTRGQYLTKGWIRLDYIELQG